MNMVTLCWLAILIGASVLSFVAGHRRGKAVGWLEKHFADVAKDRARRETNGQFKPHHDKSRLVAIKGGLS